MTNTVALFHLQNCLIGVKGRDFSLLYFLVSVCVEKKDIPLSG